MGVLDKDQVDPTIYCVLMAKSKMTGVAVAEFNAFIPKWQVSTNTFRPPVSTIFLLLLTKHGLTKVASITIGTSSLKSVD